MAGIAGIVGRDPRPAASRIEALARALLPHPKSRSESWHDDRIAVCSVSAGTSDSRPVFNQDRTKCIVFFGECFDYDAKKRELMRRGRVFALSFG